MIVEGVWVGESYKLFISDLAFEPRDMDDDELRLYCEYTSDYKDPSFLIPSPITEPVIVNRGGKPGMVATCIIANKTPIYEG